MHLPILCYHKVGPEAEEGRSLNIAPERLGDQLRFLKRRGYAFVLGRDLAQSWPARGVCLTFDDAYLSTLTYGREVLLREGAKAVFYVVSGLVGKASSWDGDKARPLAGWDLLKAAQREGFELGNHTSRHPDLSGLSIEEQRETIRECQAALAEIDSAPASFCYPYGGLSEDSPQVLKDLGFQVGMALGRRPASETDDRLRLPRIVVAFSDSVPMLAYKLYVKPKLVRA